MLGLNAGFGYGPLGATHHCMNDIAIARTLGNLSVYAPADARQAAEIVRYVIAQPGPAYIRMDSDKLPVLNASYHFRPGEPEVLHQGSDSLVFCLGTVAHEAMKVLELGDNPTIVSLPSLWPLNEAAVVALMRSHRRVLTMEEHALSGGLGTIIGELLLRHQLPRPFTALGVPAYEFTHSSSRAALRRQYAIDAAGLHAQLTP